MTTADSPATTARRPATAWLLENAVFSATMAAQRLPWTDAPARALGLDLMTRDGVMRMLLAHLRRTRSGRPVQLRTPFGSFLLPLAASDAEGMLARADEAGALGPAVGLTAGGRRYELSQHVPLPRDAAVPAAELGALVADDVDDAVASRRGDGTLEWHAWHRGMLRLSRRVVVGAAATEDTLLSEVIAVATAGVDSRPYADGAAAALGRRLAPHLADPDPCSVTGRMVAQAGGAGTGHGSDPEAAVPAVAHALALVSEAAAGTVLQALALLAVGAAASAEDAVGEALRRYPPVAAAVYPVRASFVWEDLAVEAGTEILRAPGWLRGPHDEDRPAPGTSGAPALCGAPSACAATRFAALVAEQIVRLVTATVRPVVISPQFTADRLPDTLDPRTLLVALEDLAAPSGDGRVTVGMPTAVPVSAFGYAPAAYGALAHASADRLERHAESLAACAGNSGWNKDGAGEQFRVALLGHAERCATAATGVRRAAKRLAD
ncbi:hypothetical protein ABZZ20_21555 [Streptomyces sp. NPDC006430]|uniref:hypothetical protein n=1 Tax=Streptomyces sp. NPDC006430 TaxID=3154299 RepID=UPI0033BD4931